MAVEDDVRRLAAEDVLYLSLYFVGSAIEQQPPAVVYRGRLRQALSGNWIFDPSTGTNGVAGVALGPVLATTWGSSESPATGLQVSFGGGAGGQTFQWGGSIGTVVPYDFVT